MIYQVQQKNLKVAKEIDYKNLSKGHLFQERYEIVKALEKGSGGTVYLVKDLDCVDSPISSAVSHSQVGDENQSSLEAKRQMLKVLKIYFGEAEYNFFVNELDSL